MTVNWNLAQFIRSAAKPTDFPRDRLPQVVFAGRSNVGKSSVINRLQKHCAGGVGAGQNYPYQLFFRR